MKRLGLAALCAALLMSPAAAFGASNGGKIAFASGNPLHIWTVKPNGKALHDLNAGAPADKVYCSPALSPDGTRIAYVDNNTNPPLAAPNSGYSSLVIASSDGSGARVIPNAFEGGYFCDNELSWSPDGHHVAYPGMYAGQLRAAGVVTINVDNALESPRAVGDSDHTYYTALWSPDGTRIAADGDDGHEHVFRVDGGPSVVSDRYGCSFSSWAPGAARLLEACDGPPSSSQDKGTWSINATDLGDPQPVYLGAAFDGTYSPDGSQIALRLDGSLSTMPADGSAAPTQVTSRDVYGISWSR